MEINTEINKVFGTEMAKLFASQISEEEIIAKAKEAWAKINENKDRWGTRKDSELETYIKEVILGKLHEKMYEVLQEPQNDIIVEKHARELIAKAKQVADEAIVKAMAERMVDNALNAWHTNDKFVEDVLYILHMEEENKRRYNS